MTHETTRRHHEELWLVPLAAPTIAVVIAYVTAVLRGRPKPPKATE